jgi:predicted PurR-regulated permease PerM
VSSSNSVAPPDMRPVVAVASERVNTRRARLWKAADDKGVPLRTILATVVVVVATYLAGKLVYRLRDVVLLVSLGGFFALILNPLVAALQRWKVPRRGIAVGFVTGWALVVFLGLAVAFGYPLVNGLNHLARGLPSYVQQAEHGRGWIGHLVAKYHVVGWVRRMAPKLATLGQNLGKPALALGKGAASLLAALGIIFTFTVLLLLEGPRLRASILNHMSEERAARYSRVGGDISHSITGYVLGDFMTSVIAGIVMFVTLSLVGVPYAPLWALWVALVDFLPEVGGALAGIPTVLFAFGHSLSAGIITLVAFLAYTQIENRIVNPIVMSRTAKINPLLVLISVLVGADVGAWIGGSFGAFVAALLAIPVAGAIQAIAREIWQLTAPDGPSAASGADEKQAA